MTDHNHHGPSGHVEAPHPHVLPLSLYWGVLLALLVLTGVTVWSAGFDLGPFNLPVAMLIATTKAALVLAVFMHLWFDSKLNLVVFVSSILFLSIFIVLTMFDTEARGMVDPTRENYLPRDEAVQRMEEEKKVRTIAPRPGEPFGVTTGREAFEAAQKAHKSAPPAGAH